MKNGTRFVLLGGALAAAVFQPNMGCGGSSNGDGTDAGVEGGDLAHGDAACASNSARCSDDLHSYIDGCGNVLVQCPADQGCLAGACVPACDAASGNRSSVGCEYYAVKPSDFGGVSCFVAFVANMWGSPVKVSVDRGGTALPDIGYIPSGSGTSVTYAPLVNDTIPTGSVAMFFLASGPRPPQQGEVQAVCPAAVRVGVEPDNSVQEGTGIYKAFHVVANAPVVAYDIGPYGGGSSAFAGSTLLLPTSAWDVNYIATSGWSAPLTEYSPWVGIVAKEDGTDVTIVPTADIVAGTNVKAASKNVPTVYSLAKGDLLRFYQPADLSGSIISANKPVGSWAGHGCTDLEGAACDGVHLQIPPVQALGSEYVAVRYRNRHTNWDEAPPWRFVGVVKGTTLTFDPPQSGAPTTLDSGQVVELDAAGPFVVTSQDAQHPFDFDAHMTGANAYPGTTGGPSKDGGGGMGSDGRGHAGDPETLVVAPPNQYLSRYVFFTDPTYPETNLVFVRQRGADQAFHDVDLDCAGTLGGWQPVGSGRYEFTRVDLQTGNFQKVNGCDNGRHEAHSDASFGLTVWGWGTAATGTTFSEYVSYGYPAGMSVKPVNTVVVPPVPR